MMKPGAFWRGFSLMEMMVVLLIVAIIAAASAPMVTKKMSRNAGTADSPWVFTGLSNKIAYLGENNGQVLIGATSAPNGDNSRLYISGSGDRPHIGFGNNDNTKAAYITLVPEGTHWGMVGLTDAPKVVYGNVIVGVGQDIYTETDDTHHIVALGNDVTVSKGAYNSVVIGSGSKIQGKKLFTVQLKETGNDRYKNIVAKDFNEAKSAYNSYKNLTGVIQQEEQTLSGASVEKPLSVAIGAYAQARNDASTAIGYGAITSGQRAIALGANAEAAQMNSIAIGHMASATNSENTIALGTVSEAIGDKAVAIGCQACAKHTNSVAIGYNAETTKQNQIVLGDKNTTVYIPGNLVVDKKAYIGVNDSGNYPYAGSLWIRTYNNNRAGWVWGGNAESNGQVLLRVGSNKFEWPSDRRLKNVGKAYTAGLEELKKLEFFHYTFKKDEAKTPRVGVMAQDLEKVFPDAVTKGDDGFLRIRWEDMFYAVINAVKELDVKISAVVKDITGVQETVKAQQAQIDELEKQNAELEKRIEKLEKALKKDK